jgi:hypothetical protein
VLPRLPETFPTTSATSSLAGAEMTACSAAAVSSRTMVQECGGAPKKDAGYIKVILVTLTTVYTAGGAILDLSTPFPNRVYWALPMTAIAEGTSHAYTQIGLVPGTLKTDGLGGFASTDWYITSSVSEVEATTSATLVDHVCWIVVCGC